jgi:predicted kinase
VVCVHDQVYVRSWYRRSTGWFGQVTKTGGAGIRVPGLELDVVVADLGDGDPDLRAAVDDAYRAKYGTPGDETVAGMTTDASAATTLLLAPACADAARVVLMCGVAGAGKTTYAKRLESSGYVRLSIDEEIWARFGRFGIDYDPVLYSDHLVTTEAVLRERLVDLVRAGQNVVVDFSFWERKRRDEYKQLIVDAGGSWELVYLKVSRSELRRRLAARADRFDANAAFPMSDATLDEFLTGFQEPAGEGETTIAETLSGFS